MLVPIGKYKAKAKSGGIGKSKAKGTRFADVRFEIVEGEYAGQFVGYNGYFTENTTDRTVESLRTCGCEFADGDIFNFDGIDTNVVQIVVEHDTYTPTEGEKAGQSQTKAKVAWVNELGGGGLPEEMRLDDNEKRAFQAQMKGLLLATKKKGSPNAGKGKAASGGGPANGTKPADDFGYGAQEDDAPF